MKFFKFIVSASLLFLLLWYANLGEVWGAMKSANPALFLAAFCIPLFGLILRSVKMRILLTAQGYQISLPYLFRSWLIGGFFSHLLPSTIGGDGYRVYDLSKCHVPLLHAGAIVIVDRFLGFYVLMAFALCSLPMVEEKNFQSNHLMIFTLSIFLLMNVLIWLIFFHRGEIPFFQNKMNKTIIKIKTAFAPFKGKIRSLILALGIAFVIQFGVICSYFLISKALDLQIPFPRYLTIVPYSILFELLPISIKGIGVRETFFAFVITEIYGFPLEVSLAFSWIVYGITLAWGIIGGIVYMFRKAE